MTVVHVPRTSKFICASSDTKPTRDKGWGNVVEGSSLYEYDTGKWYICYDGNSWIERADPPSLVVNRVERKVSPPAASGYAINDVVSNSISTDKAIPWTFSNVVGNNGGSGYIRKAIVESKTQDITPKLTVFLYSTTGSMNHVDNTANTAPTIADTTALQGMIDFPALEDISGGSFAIATPNTPASGIPLSFVCATGSRNLYGTVVTRDAFTNGATADMSIILDVVQE